MIYIYIYYIINHMYMYIIYSFLHTYIYIINHMYITYSKLYIYIYIYTWRIVTPDKKRSKSRRQVSNADRHVVAMTQHLFYEARPWPPWLRQVKQVK